MKIDRNAFLTSEGGATRLDQMTPEAKADAMEDFLMRELNMRQSNPGRAPLTSEIEAQVETRSYRRGTGNLFVAPEGHVKRLPPMPAKPTLVDFFRLRFS